VRNFVSFTASIAELNHGENCILNHSLTQLTWCSGNRSLGFGMSCRKFSCL